MRASARRSRPAALVAVAAVVAGCGSSGVDSDGFSAGDRKAAENALAALAQTSVYDAARDISLTEAEVPSACVVHIEQRQPLTFRVFMTWIPKASALGGAGATSARRSYSWLEAVIGAEGLDGNYSFHQGNEPTERALKSRYGNAFAKPVAKCLVLQNEHFGLLPASGN
jgi:hypothetical protein